MEAKMLAVERDRSVHIVDDVADLNCSHLVFLLPFLYANVIQHTRLVVPGSSPGACGPKPSRSYPKSPGDLGAVVATTGTTSSVMARPGEGPPVKYCDWRSRRDHRHSYRPGGSTHRCAQPG